MYGENLNDNKTILIDKVEFNKSRFSKPYIDEGKVAYITHEIKNSQSINPQFRMFDLTTKEID